MLRVELKTLTGILCEIRLDLGEPEDSSTSEVLPHLSEGVLRLGEPETAVKCCFSCCTILYAGRFLKELLTQRGLNQVI